MNTERKSQARCAIYTRKSSEEGLEQSFNSLDAQREACQAFILSQRQEGWRLIDTHYDDGGYSGGTLERPAIKRLLDDIRAGRIDVVVVYKVDRLTRSLADFAKLIEVFDAQQVSFVSVTQQFNTTSSMGRLTLNVLLSFAQFEREVAGERIRDKIAASKRKGMWMGGMVPLGYDIQDRKLIVNNKEADLVRDLYKRYLKSGCVARLKQDIDREGIKTKVRISKVGRKSGGAAFSRGALYEFLQNRIYLGEIKHRGLTYPGQHQQIIPKDLWDKVQALLRSNSDARRNGINARSPSLLAGILFDETGNRFTPSHTVKDKKRYRYYVSQTAIQNRSTVSSAPVRIPAQEIENAVVGRLQSFLTSKHELLNAFSAETGTPASAQIFLSAAQKIASNLKEASTPRSREFVRAFVARISVQRQSIKIDLIWDCAQAVLLGDKHIPNSESHAEERAQPNKITLTITAQVKRCGGESKLIVDGEESLGAPQFAPSMIKAMPVRTAGFNRSSKDS
jgi:site-specific DNA recombinase